MVKFYDSLESFLVIFVGVSKFLILQKVLYFHLVDIFWIPGENPGFTMGCFALHSNQITREKIRRDHYYFTHLVCFKWKELFVDVFFARDWLRLQRLQRRIQLLPSNMVHVSYLAYCAVLLACPRASSGVALLAAIACSFKLASIVLQSYPVLRFLVNSVG